MGYIYDLVERIKAENFSSDPYELCENYGVRIKISNDIYDLCGMFTFVVDTPCIIINGNLHERVQKLVCAHELGHYFLHSDIAKEKCLQEFEIFDMRDRTEYEANTFAAHLLIDDDELIELLKSGRDCFLVAMILNVNPNLLNIKLSDMNRMGYSFPTSWGSSRLF